MRARFSHILLTASLAGIALTGLHCDFPDDPPLKAPATPPVSEISRIDSAAALLELKHGISWVYMAVPKGGVGQTYIMNPVEFMHGGTRYMRAPYGYMETHGRFTLSLPLLMRQVDKSISFYDFPLDTLREPGRTPRFAFMLPYPAGVGRVTPDINGPTSGVTTKVVAKDTVITDQTGAPRRVYRYEVQGYHNGRTVIYVLPGKALLRIEQDDVDYHTFTWIGL